ncbi:MAG: hypothetical protein WCA77_02100, partial [Thermoplasmata archaeon]
DLTLTVVSASPSGIVVPSYFSWILVAVAGIAVAALLVAYSLRRSHRDKPLSGPDPYAAYRLEEAEGFSRFTGQSDLRVPPTSAVPGAHSGGQEDDDALVGIL